MASPRVLPPDPENDELRGAIVSLGRFASRVGLAPPKLGAPFYDASHTLRPGLPARDLNGGPLLVEVPVRSAAEAVERLRVAASPAGGTQPSALWLLGEAHEHGEGVPAPDLAEAVRFYRLAAEAGSAHAADALRRLGVRWSAPRRPAEPEEAPQPVPPRFITPPWADAFLRGAEALGSKHMTGKDSH
jgi:hypothetical protein